MKVSIGNGCQTLPKLTFSKLEFGDDQSQFGAKNYFLQLRTRRLIKGLTKIHTFEKN